MNKNGRERKAEEGEKVVGISNKREVHNADGISNTLTSVYFYVVTNTILEIGNHCRNVCKVQ